MKPKKVLIVDDDDSIRKVAKLSLERIAGWEVICAESGRRGILLAERERPDAILLDVMMPELDGPNTFLLLQDNPLTRGVPVILLTAKVQAIDRKKFEGLGVASVLPKPFDPLTLSKQVAQSLGWEA